MGGNVNHVGGLGGVVDVNVTHVDDFAGVGNVMGC
jgi:hypothetical protein